MVPKPLGRGDEHVGCTRYKARRTEPDFLSRRPSSSTLEIAECLDPQHAEAVLEVVAGRALRQFYSVSVGVTLMVWTGKVRSHLSCLSASFSWLLLDHREAAVPATSLALCAFSRSQEARMASCSATERNGAWGSGQAFHPLPCLVGLLLVS